MTAQQYVEMVENRGKKLGSEALLAHQIERRLKRPLTTEEGATLRARLETLSAEQVSDTVMDLSAGELAAWLAPKVG